MLNSQVYKNEIYPCDFNEDDKLNFDILVNQASVLFPKLQNEEWLIKQAVIAYIRREKGEGIEITEENTRIIKEKYDNIVE